MGFKILFAMLAISLGADFASGETYCSRELPEIADPHQESGLLERLVNSRLHVHLLGEGGIVEEIAPAGGTKWRLRLKKGQHFSTGAPITARDVEASLKRQLIRHAELESDEEAFVPSKLVNLDRKLQGLSATSPFVIELNFSEKLEKKEIEGLLAPPVGFVLPQNFPEVPSFELKPFPSGGEIILARGTDQSLRLMKGARTELEIKHLSGGRDSYQEAKSASCKRVYYPDADLIRKAANSKFRATKVKASEALLYLRIFQEVKMPPHVLRSLRSVLHPDNLPALKNFSPTNRILAVSQYGPSDTAGLPPGVELPATIVTCQHPGISPEEMKKLEEEIEALLKKHLQLDVSWLRFGCERLVALKHSPEKLAVLTTLETKDVIRALDCSATSIPLLGMCPSGSQQEKEAAVLSSGRILPLARIPYEFVEFY